MRGEDGVIAPIIFVSFVATCVGSVKTGQIEVHHKILYVVRKYEDIALEINAFKPNDPTSIDDING